MNLDFLAMMVPYRVKRSDILNCSHRPCRHNVPHPPARTNMSILNKLIGLLEYNDKSVIPNHTPSSWLQVVQTQAKLIFRRFKWHVYNRMNLKILGSVLITAATCYIVLPSLIRSDRVEPGEYSKRPDKFTTGFVNTGNDCFANSTIQSLVPLHQLNRYFQRMLDYKLPECAVKYPMPLHLALMHLLRKLQETIRSPSSISVWDLLHLLEQIHVGKISRNQHDAHELLTLLLETLEDEYTRFFSFMSKLTEGERVKIEEPPKFPFHAVVESKLRCLNCKCISKPLRMPMMMLELMVPQGISNVTLESLISKERSELIGGYSCIVCMTKMMIFSPNTLNLIDQEQKDFVELLKSKIMSGTLCINDDLYESPIYKSILANSPHLLASNVKSTVQKEVVFTESTPDIIPIHLSRSIFADSQSWRNSCSVSFPLILEFKNTNSTLFTEYTLRSVIRHQGSHSSGHYECYRRKPEYRRTAEGDIVDDTPKFGDENHDARRRNRGKRISTVENKPFWRISDTKIKEVSSDALICDGQAAYMLFYEKV
jgi:ubiquitin carboxyl-terminal hydrolase 16